MLKQEDYKQHISERFNTELEGIKNRLLEMGGKVEQQLNEAVAALIAGDTGTAEAIINRDHEVIRWKWLSTMNVRRFWPGVSRQPVIYAWLSR